VLVLCPDALEFSHAREKPNRYHIEPSIDFQRQELHSFPWEALDRSKPLIYCSLGSESHLYKQSFRIFSAIIEAMRTKPDWQLLLAIGPYLKMDDLPPLPTNVLVVNWAPQLQILQRAAMMITHGGLGSVKECIFLGVPMIVFPCRWDQPTNAARVVAHGLGVRGNVNHVSSHEVIAMIDNVSGNPSFKRSVEAMSRTFREIEDSGRGVELIEQIIGSFKKDPGFYATSRSRAELLPIQ
jgi:zeaxanthin glucosyltransferase